MKLVPTKFRIEPDYFGDGTIVRRWQWRLNTAKDWVANKIDTNAWQSFCTTSTRLKAKANTPAVSSRLKCRPLPKYTNLTKDWFCLQTNSLPADQHTMSIFLPPFMLITNNSQDTRRSYCPEIGSVPVTLSYDVKVTNLIQPGPSAEDSGHACCTAISIAPTLRTQMPVNFSTLHTFCPQRSTIIIFVHMMLFPWRQMGKAWKPSKK